MNKTFRRVLAYAIDMLLVFFVFTTLGNSSIINFQLNSYTKYYDEYEKIFNSYVEHQNNDLKDCQDLEKAITDEKITEEEYISKYDALVREKENISEEEYNDKCSNIIIEYKDKSLTEEELSQEVDYYFPKIKFNSIMTNVIYIVICLLYFVLFQGFTGGQTLGKKITHLRVVSTNGQDLSYQQLFIRTLFLYDIVFLLTMTFTWVIIPVKYYSIVIQLLSIGSTALMFIIYCMICLRKDKKGLHDLVSHTQVIEVKKINKA